MCAESDGYRLGQEEGQVERAGCGRWEVGYREDCELDRHEVEGRKGLRQWAGLFYWPRWGKVGR